MTLLSLQCEGADGPTCLTAAQVETARALYAPVKNPNSGGVIYPALQPGSELAWNVTGKGKKGESINLKVTAPAGTKLYFMCLIHPWMQAEVDVT